NWGRTLAQKRAYDEALRVFRTGQTKAGGNWAGFDGEIGYVLGMQGATNAALQIVQDLRAREAKEFVDPYIYAMIYVAVGDSGKAFEALNQACDLKTPWVPSLVVDPKFKTLHREPGYQRIVERLKLPAAKTTAIQ